MIDIGCHCAAWIRGIFFVSLLTLSACSEKDETAKVAAVEQPPFNAQVVDEIKPFAKRPPFSQLVIDKITIDYPYTPTNDFKAFIKKLSTRIDNENIKALKAELAPVFNCKGLACESGLPISEHFHSIVASLGKNPWPKLKNIVDTKYYQLISGGVCGPARATFNDGRDSQSQGNWGYITGKKVRLRQQPSTKSTIVTHLSHEAVQQSSTRSISKGGIHWLKIETATGKKGFVAAKYFQLMNPKQICYQDVAGEWKISGFRDNRN